MKMRKPRVQDLKNAEVVVSHKKGVFKDETIVKVITAPQDWKCDKCGAAIKQGEQCIKIGKNKMCAVHVKRIQDE